MTPEDNRLVGETHAFSDWKSDPRFKEGDDIIYRAYAAVHGRDSDIAKESYEKSLEREDTLVRVISDLNERIQAIWYLRRGDGYLKARSGAPRKDDLDFDERRDIYSKILEIVPELDLPLVVEPDMRQRAISDTFDWLGLSTVWCEDELQKIMGEDYEKTHKFMEHNKYGQARFWVRNSVGREFERRAYASYPKRMVKPKTLVRVMGEYDGFEFKDANVRREKFLAMLRKDPATSQTKQGGLYEFVGGNVDPDEKVMEAAEREFREETGLDPSLATFEEIGNFRYQYFHRSGGGTVFEPHTTVFRATFPGGRIGEWPRMHVERGTDDRHISGEWLSEKDIKKGDVELTRVSQLMRLRYLANRGQR